MATAKAVKTLQRLKSPLVMQSPVVAARGKSLPTRTQVKSVLTILAIAISADGIPFGNSNQVFNHSCLVRPY